MKKIFLAAALVSITFLLSCKSGGGDPKAVLTEFFDALAKKDLAKARTLATADSKQMFDLMEIGMKSGEAKDMGDYDKSKMEFGEVKIDGEKATVAVKDKNSGEVTNFPLKKENGTWKVAFDKSSMMEMGMQKMKEKGLDNAVDSLKEGMDKLKNMNIDSLKGQMEEGLKALDSVK